MLKLVLDTNTYISGFLWDGNEAKLIRLIEGKKALAFTQKEILEEIDKVLRRDKFALILKNANTTPDEILSKIANISVIIIGAPLRENIIKEDKSDDKFIECALNAKAEIIISGDKHLLKIKEFRGIKIMKTADALKLLKR